jgi:phosphoserine phosphatase RsbU/P
LNTLAIAPKSARSILKRRLLLIEAGLVFVVLFVYAMLVALDQHPVLWPLLICVIVVGNVIIPVAWVCWAFIARFSAPWNWLVFLPAQGFFSLICASSSVAFLKLSKYDTRPFWAVFRDVGPLTIVVCMAGGIMILAVGEVQKKLRQRNELLEQTVEKGTIKLQEQEEELKRAREIQQALLPNTLPQIPGAQIAGAWQPARAVGGDYFDVIKLDDKRVGICVADVAGKGITAALLMANLQASFRALATADATPQSVCTKLNAFLCANTATGKFVTFFYAVLNMEDRTVTYENAGHCPGLLLRATGETESLAGGGAVLGALPDWAYANYNVQLRSGDKLLLTTDGISEAEDANLEEFGEARLLDAARMQNGSAMETQRAIMQQVTIFCGGNFRDDATIVVLAMT